MPEMFRGHVKQFINTLGEFNLDVYTSREEGAEVAPGQETDVMKLGDAIDGLEGTVAGGATNVHESNGLVKTGLWLLDAVMAPSRVWGGMYDLRMDDHKTVAYVTREKVFTNFWDWFHWAVQTHKENPHAVWEEDPDLWWKEARDGIAAAKRVREEMTGDERYREMMGMNVGFSATELGTLGLTKNLPAAYAKHAVTWAYSLVGAPDVEDHQMPLKPTIVSGTSRGAAEIGWWTAFGQGFQNAIDGKGPVMMEALSKRWLRSINPDDDWARFFGSTVALGVDFVGDGWAALSGSLRTTGDLLVGSSGLVKGARAAEAAGELAPIREALEPVIVKRMKEAARGTDPTAAVLHKETQEILGLRSMEAIDEGLDIARRG